MWSRSPWHLLEFPSVFEVCKKYRRGGLPEFRAEAEFTKA